MAVFEDKKSSNDIINNGTMSDDGVVASDVPPGHLFPSIPRETLSSIPHSLTVLAFMLR